MKSAVLLAPVFAIVASVCFASDQSLTDGVPGSYARTNSMFTDTLDLKRDRTFVFTHRFDIGSDTENGLWKVVDSVVVLDPKKHGHFLQKWPSRLLIVAMDGDLALRELDDGAPSDDEQEPALLFRPVKKTANKSSDPTARSVTPPADAGDRAAAGRGSS